MQNMFQALADELKNNKTKSGSGYQNLIKFEKGKSYEFRFVMNPNNPAKTIYNVIEFSWTSRATGEYMSIISPSMFDNRCPVNEVRTKLYRGSPEEIEIAKGIKKRTIAYVNVFVVKDPTRPENEGKIKILKMVKQIKDIVDVGLVGSEAEDIGPLAFNLKNGINFTVNVTDQGGYFNYQTSRWGRKQTSVVETTEEDIYSQIFDLENLFPVKSFEELQEIVQTHILGDVEILPPPTTDVSTSSNTSSKKNKTTGVEDDVDVEDEDDTLKELAALAEEFGDD